MYIGWKNLLDGWVKLNCDGAYKGNGELAVVAGSSDNLMASGSRVLAAKLELVMLCMLRCGVFIWAGYGFERGYISLDC